MRHPLARRRRRAGDRRSSVDLPTPFSPIRPSRWPGATVKPRSVKMRRCGVRDREPVGAEVEGSGRRVQPCETSVREVLPGRRPTPPARGGHERCTERRARGTMARTTTRERSVDPAGHSPSEGCARDQLSRSAEACTPVSTAPQARDDGVCSLHSGYDDSRGRPRSQASATRRRAQSRRRSGGELEHLRGLGERRLGGRRVDSTARVP